MVLAVLCGVAVPLSPLGAEYFVTTRIAPVSWFAVAVTYVAGVGLVSKSRTVLVSALIGASVIAFIYGVNMKGAFDAAQVSATLKQSSAAPPLDPTAAIWMTGAATLVYLVEILGRHLIVGKPFLEA